MPGTKTNERPGTRAVLRHCRMSATKARRVLDLIRGQEVGRAAEILQFCERDAAITVGKVLASAVANAEHNDSLAPDDLFVSACFADEGATIKRWRPRARGRATRIRKRTCHITMIVGRLPDDRLSRHRRRQSADAAALRARRVAGGRQAERDGGRVRRTTPATPTDQNPTAPAEPEPALPPPATPAEPPSPEEPLAPSASAAAADPVPPGEGASPASGAGSGDSASPDDEGTRE